MQSADSLPRISCAILLAHLIFPGLSGCSNETGDASTPDSPVAQSVAAEKNQRDPGDRITVSGVSSGAYMAVQTHVALADRVTGVASVAGGPWHCAEGAVGNAIGRCLSGDGLDVSTLIARAYELAASAEVAGVDQIARARVYVQHSPDDGVVAPELSSGLADFYAAFVPSGSLRHATDLSAPHGWPTLQTGAGCSQMGGDFINACDHDTAGELLRHFYPRLEPRVEDSVAGNLTTIDLGTFFSDRSGVASQGFVFTPDNCSADTSACRLHVAFHGCRMGAEFIEDRFAAGAGFNEWAANNSIVVLYPQVEKSAMNPHGCWDWWGYTGADYDRKSGQQVAGVSGVIDAFLDGELPRH